MIESDSLFGIAALCYIVYWCVSICTDTTKYIFNKMELDECMGNILVAIRNPPKMLMIIKNYHYETKTTTDSKGNTRTKRVKDYTHSA